LPDYSREDPDPALMARFSGQPTEGLEDAARVLSLLRKAISRNRLQSIAVECFSLVQQRKVTACLALAQLNAEGMVAACEGDLASLAGMMAGKAVTGVAPWMANTTLLTDKTLILSHCTASFDFMSSVHLQTHYETGYSLAIAGRVYADCVTLFRLNDRLDRAFIAEGRVISHPQIADACRTQAEIELSEHQIVLLREKPLGNHLLVVPFKCEEIFRLLCRYKNIEVIN
jgi:L-fucose isomerase-like protein